MDWTTLGIITLVCIGLMINFLPVHYIVRKDFPNYAFPQYVIPAITAPALLILELLVIFLAVGGILFLMEWGVLNVIATVSIILTVIVVPLLGTNLLIKSSVIIPHLLKRFFTNFRKERLVYKEHIEDKFPIKRSVYELIDTQS